jgi:hypothetical protein
MTRSSQIVADSLELLAERAGDPCYAVYAHLFAAYPEMETLFVRDTTGAVRGEMLAVAFQCPLDLEGPYAANLIACERVSPTRLHLKVCALKHRVRDCSTRRRVEDYSKHAIFRPDKSNLGGLAHAILGAP